MIVLTPKSDRYYKQASSKSFYLNVKLKTFPVQGLLPVLYRLSVSRHKQTGNLYNGRPRDSEQPRLMPKF